MEANKNLCQCNLSYNLDNNIMKNYKVKWLHKNISMTNTTNTCPYLSHLLAKTGQQLIKASCSGIKEHTDCIFLVIISDTSLYLFKAFLEIILTSVFNKILKKHKTQS